MPERQGTGEGATRGLQVTPNAPVWLPRASHCLARSLPAPCHPQIWKPKLLVNQIQPVNTLKNVQGPCFTCNTLLRGTF